MFGGPPASGASPAAWPPGLPLPSPVRLSLSLSLPNGSETKQVRSTVPNFSGESFKSPSFIFSRMRNICVRDSRNGEAFAGVVAAAGALCATSPSMPCGTNSGASQRSFGGGVSAIRLTLIRGGVTESMPLRLLGGDRRSASPGEAPLRLPAALAGVAGALVSQEAGAAGTSGCCSGRGFEPTATLLGGMPRASAGSTSGSCSPEAF
mmetsp:Transcript_32879/g.71756  ORF Transcript_32879/g.71756 Transcript_32879/m.71756 type:complete len:207 (+) Transcript_32879:462-1082(+)